MGFLFVIHTVGTLIKSDHLEAGKGRSNTIYNSDTIVLHNVFRTILVAVF